MGAALKIGPEARPRTQERKHPRANAYLCIDLCSEHNFWTGLTMNVSEGGVFVATHVLLDPGALVSMHLELPKARILALGEVRWRREYTGDDDIPPGMGVQFVNLDEAALEAIRTFVATIREPLLYEP
jgi:uncharacterized protein (TIGR02266 family)